MTHAVHELDTLLKATANRDENAFCELYEKTCAIVNGLATRITGDPATAEDVTVDVFAQVWDSAERYDSAVGSPEAWILNMTRSRAIDRLRSRAAGTRSGHEPIESAEHVPSFEPTPEESYAVTERRGIITDALTRLAPERRRVIELAYFSGFSHADIAARLDQPLGTVKTRARLGMMELRQVLDRTRKELL